MNYIDYYETYYNYRQAKNDLHNLQNEIADIINCLISTTSKMSDEIGSGSKANDKMLQLTAKKIELESKEELVKALLIVRTNQKNDAEEELRKSKELKDQVYLLYYLDHIRPREIAQKLNFVTSYIYNLLGEIKEDIYNYDKKHKKK